MWGDIVCSDPWKVVELDFCDHFMGWGHRCILRGRNFSWQKLGLWLCSPRRILVFHLFHLSCCDISPPAHQAWIWNSLYAVGTGPECTFITVCCKPDVPTKKKPQAGSERLPYSQSPLKVKVAQLSPTLCDPMDYYSPWNHSGQNTGVGSLSPLQVIFPTQGSNPGLLHCKRILYHLNHRGSPRILEWGAYTFSSGSCWPRNQTRISCIAGGFFTSWATREVFYISTYSRIYFNILWYEEEEIFFSYKDISLNPKM